MSNLKLVQKNLRVNSILINIEKQLIQILSPFIWKISKNNNIMIIHTTRYNLKYLLSIMKINSLYKNSQLIDIIALDFLQKQIRFIVNYNLLSLDYSNRIFIQVKINEKLSLPSVVSLFESSNWLEREVLDMFGISFKFNLDLRRILTDYGFNGYPLRKDFALTGHLEEYYNDNMQTIENQMLFFFQQQRQMSNE